MVVHYFHAFRVAVIPCEANAPLIAYPNAVLPFPAALERFQTVSRLRLQIQEPTRPMQVLQLAPSRVLNIRRQLSRALAMENPLGFLAPKADDHYATISRRDNMSSQTAFEQNL